MNASGGLLAGKTIVVTGAGRGIGREVALECARQGASVVVNDLGGDAHGTGRSEAPASGVVAEIEAGGGRAIASFANVAKWDDAQGVVAGAIESFGRIDGVVNCAGILRDRIFHKMSEEEFDAVVAVHLKGAFQVSRAAAPHFKAQSGGAFVHMTSTSGLIGNVGQANYAAAKMGIAALSKSIALDMARYNTVSNCIAPFAMSRMIGTIPTADAEGKARLERLKDMTPAKIAPLAGVLCSDAAKSVSGQIFAVRNNEIFLFSQPRPIRSAQASAGWTAEAIIDRVLPAFRPDMPPLDRTSDVFCWDPI